MLKSDVFHRSFQDSAAVSTPTYNLIIGLVLCWGFVINWWLVNHVDSARLEQLHIAIFLLVYFASCLFGIYLFKTSREPAISFLGYNLVVVPFGLVINIAVSRHDPALVVQAIEVTGAVTLVMMLLGMALPRLFQAIYSGLIIALLAVLAIELFQIFVLGIHSDWIDWAVAAIFCGYIGYDWGRANQIPKTIDNAVDSAAAIYMDIINLFLRILRILGRK